jgi:predicted PurR-regulated permease PerM
MDLSILELTCCLRVPYVFLAPVALVILPHFRLLFFNLQELQEQLQEQLQELQKQLQELQEQLQDLLQELQQQLHQLQ